MFLTTVDPDALEADLAAGRLRCPGCQRPLAPWGFGRWRVVRMRDGACSLRPRRARCGRCETTHVIVPSWSVPRRRDGADVIGSALLASARGDGYRKIAARLGRPPETVRGWLRVFLRRAEVVRAAALRWVCALDPGQPRAELAGGPLAQAVDALGRAARACRIALGARAGPWELAVALTGLLYGNACDPP